MLHLPYQREEPSLQVEDLILLGMVIVIQNPYLTRQKTRFYWVFGLAGLCSPNDFLGTEGEKARWLAGTCQRNLL